MPDLYAVMTANEAEMRTRIGTSNMTSYRYRAPQELHLLSILAQTVSRQASGCLRVTDNTNIWMLFLERGKLVYASNSLDPFGRLDQYLRRLSAQIPSLASPVRVQVRLLFEKPMEEAIGSCWDYAAICWLVEQQYLTPVQAADLIQSLSKEVLESLLPLQFGSYDLLSEGLLTELPRFCHLDVRTLVESCQVRRVRQRVSRENLDGKAASSPSLRIQKPASPADPATVQPPTPTPAPAPQPQPPIVSPDPIAPKTAVEPESSPAQPAPSRSQAVSESTPPPKPLAPEQPPTIAGETQSGPLNSSNPRPLQRATPPSEGDLRQSPAVRDEEGLFRRTTPQPEVVPPKGPASPGSSPFRQVAHPDQVQSPQPSTPQGYGQFQKPTASPESTQFPPAASPSPPKSPKPSSPPSPPEFRQPAPSENFPAADRWSPPPSPPGAETPTGFSAAQPPQTFEPGMLPKTVYTIACIDDSPAVLNAIESFLDDRAFKILRILEPLSALMQIIRSKPDLILLDVTMPNLDGYELCSLLRRHPSFKQTPIIMVTGNTGLINRAKAKLAGASGYLTKPFTQSELLKIVFKHLIH